MQVVERNLFCESPSLLGGIGGVKRGGIGAVFCGEGT